MNNSVSPDLSMNEQNSEEYTTEDWSAIMNALQDLYEDSDIYDTSMSISTNTSNPNSHNSFTPRQLFNGDDIQIRNTDSEDSDDESDSNSLANFDMLYSINTNNHQDRPRNNQRTARKRPRCLSETNLIGLSSFATFYIEKAKEADRRNRNKLAIEYYAAAIELDPYMEYLSDYATCLEKDHQYLKAEKYYLEAIDNLDPRSRSNLAIYNLADMYLHLSKVKIKTSSGRVIHNQEQVTLQEQENVSQNIQLVPIHSESQESSIEFSNQKKEEETSTNRLVINTDVNVNNTNNQEEEVTWYIDRNPTTEKKDENESPQETFKPFDDNTVYEPEVKPTPCHYKDKAIQYFILAADRGDKESLEIACVETFQYKTDLFAKLFCKVLENKEHHIVLSDCPDDYEGDEDDEETYNRKFAVWMRRHHALGIRDYLLNNSYDLQNKHIQKCLSLFDKESIVNIFKNKVELFTKLNHITECGICYDKKLNIDLNCGHCVCTDCYKRVYYTNCPFCREPGLDGFSIMV